jgi:Zn finger protein HypA/HybF involved in hydrogenase expression
VKSEPGTPATLGSTAVAGARLIVWCRDCGHQVEPDPAEQAERYGAEMTIPIWRERLICSKCGSREIDMVVSGTKRR